MIQWAPLICRMIGTAAAIFVIPQMRMSDSKREREREREKNKQQRGIKKWGGNKRFLGRKRFFQSTNSEQ